MNNENVTGVNFNQFSEPVAELDLDDCKVDHCEEDHQHSRFCSLDHSIPIGPLWLIHLYVFLCSTTHCCDHL